MIPLKAYITIPEKEIRKWRNAMQSKEKRDFEDYGHKGEQITTWTAKFGHGIEADLKIVTPLSVGENPWCEVVFFRDGIEAACTDVSDELTGEWKAEIDGQEYIVEVVSDEAPEKDETKDEAKDILKMTDRELLAEFADRVEALDSLRDDEWEFESDHGNRELWDEETNQKHDKLLGDIQDARGRVANCITLIRNNRAETNGGTDGMSVKDKIQDAIDAAYKALFARLSELGVEFEDCDSATYFDDDAEKKTYYIPNISICETDEYGGE